MARGHPDLPKAESRSLRKLSIFLSMLEIDKCPEARARVLAMENGFRGKIDSHLSLLPDGGASFDKFNTSPFVLLFYSRQQNFSFIDQIEGAIVPAKVFSSMETSAGRMVEEVVLPVYGWECVQSAMHSSNSLLDGHCLDWSEGVYSVATLKSGPRCLNDEMAQNIGQDIVRRATGWTNSKGVEKLNFVYGVLYGTAKKSNKKDWHVLRNAAEYLDGRGTVMRSHKDSWSLAFEIDGVEAEVSVKVGIDWWDHLGGKNAWLEVCIALIRACVVPAPTRQAKPDYIIEDLGEIVSLPELPDGYNLSLLQRSQYEWALFIARHFCDQLV